MKYLLSIPQLSECEEVEASIPAEAMERIWISGWVQKKLEEMGETGLDALFTAADEPAYFRCYVTPVLDEDAQVFVRVYELRLDWRPVTGDS